MSPKESTSPLKTKDEYFLRHPGDQTFYKVVAFVMGIFGLNSEFWSWFKRPATIFYDMQRWLIIICVPLACASQLLYLNQHYKYHEFSSLSVIFSMIPVSFVVLIKTVTAQTPSYKKVMTAFTDKIHLHTYLSKDYTEHKLKYIAQEVITAEKYTRWTNRFFMTFVFICVCAWHTVPVIHNINNNSSINNITKRLEVCLHFWLPFDYEFNFYAYLFVQIMGMYCGAVGMTVLVIFDTVNLAFIFHLVGHIRIIKYDLRHNFMEENLSEKELKRRLVNITNYYGFIVNTFKDVEAAFGLNVASIYAQNLIQGGLLLYQLLTKGNDLETLMTFGLMLPIIVGNLMLISFMFENVRIQAEDIPTLVYELPWEPMSISNKKIILSILFQVQPTLEFKAAFNIKTGVQPALNIIKTTFSYYVMIKARV